MQTLATLPRSRIARRAPLYVLACLVAALFLVAVQPGCTTLSKVPQIEDMEETEFIAWRNTLVAQVKIVAQAAYDEGEIECKVLDQMASVLAVMGGTNQVEAGQLAKWLELSGYKAAVLQLAILELDSKLAAGGAYVDGILGPHGKETLLYLGVALEGVCDEP